ncbi:MAG TPA: TonB-dependent receptor plug domain-containing protein, partial [Longimicrobiales bacterium]|nr:TonB-dependent receptor plug domain-containing protein [Longimicrobiales bacterium]
RLFGDMVDLQRRMEMGFGDFLVRRDLEHRGGTLASALQGRLGVRVLTGGNRPGERYIVLRQSRDITSVPASRQNGETLDAGPAELIQEYCFPSVWVDGRRFSTPRSGGVGHDPVDFSQFLTLDIEAVEVYRGAASVPGEFGGGDAACGAVVIWTHRGGRTVRGNMGPGSGTEMR